MLKQQLKHLLSLWLKVLEKLTVAEIVEKSPLFYGNKFMLLFSRVRHLSHSKPDGFCPLPSCLFNILLALAIA
jgi:hypothetical protein